MKLEFPESFIDPSSSTGQTNPLPPPTFSRLASFRTIGVVMNVFLLDPSSRLLSAFVWVSSSNTIGLFALLDWNKREYVFVDTGIECVSPVSHVYLRHTEISPLHICLFPQSMSSNWSCILYKEQIVIHSEESDIAFQYFYPISVLQNHTQTSATDNTFVPSLSTRLPPSSTMQGKFVFPSSRPSSAVAPAQPPGPVPGAMMNGFLNGIQQPLPPTPPPTVPGDAEQNTPTNPFPFPPWYPESAHFVRQWWPTLPTVPRLSCTVVLLADHDPDSHRTRYVLAQHYFKVPLLSRHHHQHQHQHHHHHHHNHQHQEITTKTEPGKMIEDGASPSSSSSVMSLSPGSATCGDESDASSDDGGDGAAEESMLRIWYVSTPFEVVCVLDGIEDETEDGGAPVERPRPLMAVDFGHAVWVEYVDGGQIGTEAEEEPSDAKRLRFVSFPPVTMVHDEDRLDEESIRRVKSRETEGVVRTLIIPDELDLDTVETINIDQSQGAVIISVREGKIFILCYE